MAATSPQTRDDDRRMCAVRAARMLDALRKFYDDCVDEEPEVLLKYALCDLRHVADLELTISFAACDRSGYQLYLQELHGAG